MDHAHSWLSRLVNTIADAQDEYCPLEFLRGAGMTEGAPGCFIYVEQRSALVTALLLLVFLVR